MDPDTKEEEETAATADSADPWQYVPAVPMTIKDTGIPESYLRELVLKTLWAHDKPTLAAISEVTGLHVRVVEDLVTEINREHLCDVDTGISSDNMQFPYRLTERGKTAAHEALQRSRYVGVAPVPVGAYNQMIEEQIQRFKRPPLDEIRQALSHLVMPERLIEVIGQAFFSRRALMIYGPSGNGKTDIVTSVARVVAGTVIIPYALYGHGQLIRVFDPDIHKSQVDNQQKSEGVWADKALRHDRRWLPVNRPTVIVGGDMGAEALEMTYDATQGVHNAPLSIVAQGGVLVIDDLGRQKISPKEILNRWVLMMEQGYDSFALSSSEIVRLPLDVTLIFSTNLTLQDLMDEAYLRRIAYKVAIPDPDRSQLAEITRLLCTRRELKWTEDAIEHLMDRLFEPGQPVPRGCYPRDIITTVIDEAEFHGREAELNKESIDTALMLYLGSGDFSAQAA
jgi:predicted ATPase with chaperone activity